MPKFSSIIVGTGCYIPTENIANAFFLDNRFFDKEGNPFTISNQEIIDKFKSITNIEDRKYVNENMVCSDISFLSASNALNSSGIDPETLDYIIVAHNFGDVRGDNRYIDSVPTIASRVKHRLKIKNPDTVAYDILFGCPGWLEAMIQANYYLQSGNAKRIMVIGAETLSRVSDPHDRDSMIYADGAGAAIVEAQLHESEVGIITHATRTDTYEAAYLLNMDKTYNKDNPSEQLYLKMEGRKLYEYALQTVPDLIKKCLHKANLSLTDIQKVLIHQANEKMDYAILKKLFSEYGIKKIPANIMPMTINQFGNSSVATLPTLLDLILKGKLPNQTIHSGDNILFASVGAGMNINALVYRMI